jgi:hypothetical protein
MAERVATFVAECYRPDVTDAVLVRINSKKEEACARR